MMGEEKFTQSEAIQKPKRGYHLVSDETRQKLITMVEDNPNGDLQDIATILGLNFNTCKTILRVYSKTGRKIKMPREVACLRKPTRMRIHGEDYLDKLIQSQPEYFQSENRYMYSRPPPLKFGSALRYPLGADGATIPQFVLPQKRMNSEDIYTPDTNLQESNGGRENLFDFQKLTVQIQNSICKRTEDHHSYEQPNPNFGMRIIPVSYVFNSNCTNCTNPPNPAQYYRNY